VNGGEAPYIFSLDSVSFDLWERIPVMDSRSGLVVVAKRRKQLPVIEFE
jgi:hypothetical protein